VSERTESIVRGLNAEEKVALEAGLDLAARIAGASRPLSLAQVQALYDGFLEEGITDTDSIIALGLAFGDDMVRHGGLIWVRVIDEYGDETCVSAPHHIVDAAPISMIQKRLNRKEDVDLLALRAATLQAIERQVQKAMSRN
jgi:hypothetical protein